MQGDKEFLIYGILEKDSTITVTGICKDKNIHVGDRFNLAFRYKYNGNIDDYGKVGPRKKLQNIDLVVTTISWNVLDSDDPEEVASGHTLMAGHPGRLSLKGKCPKFLLTFECDVISCPLSVDTNESLTNQELSLRKVTEIQTQISVNKTESTSEISSRSSGKFDKKEFYVVEVKRKKSKALVSGRCGDVPIRVGDVFNVIFCYENPEFLNHSTYEIPKINVRKVRIKVEAIICYMEYITELAPAYTALLEITGRGLSLLGKYKHNVLSNIPQVHRDDEPIG